jgi:hypothetical protein
MLKRIRIPLLALAMSLASISTEAALVFNTNAVWKLFKGRTEASSPDSTAWRRLIFDDAAFTPAPSPFWYGDAQPGGTELPDMLNGYSSIFLRRTFVVTNLADFSTLQILSRCDDGYLVWINTTNVLRYNMPAGNIAYNGGASGAITEPATNYTATLPTPSTYLVLGTNQVAVQVFNAGIGSSDLGWDLSLANGKVDNDAPVIAAITPAPGTVNELRQLTVFFSEPVVGINASDLLINGTPATTVSGGSEMYTFTFTQPPLGNVQITWAASHGIADVAAPTHPFLATAPGATWQYSLVDNTPPTLVYQLPFAGVTTRSLTQVEVNFSEPVANVDAADLLINGAPATNVTQLAPNQFVFSFPSPPAGSVAVAFAAGHAIRDFANPPNNFSGGSWSYVLDPNAPVTAVRLNELAAANVNGLRDEDNETQDWVELFNTSSNAVSLAGWSLTDDEDDPARWIFPPVSIGPRSYLIVFCSGKDRKPLAPGTRLHTNFKLNPDGEFLGLYNAEVPRQLVSSFNPYPNQRTDYSWGYDPLDQFKYFQTATPGTNNGASTITGVVSDTKFSHDRGFYSAPFSLSITCATPGVTIRYSTNGTPPTVSSGLIYSAPIPIAATKIVQAAAFKTGLLASDVDAQTYLFLDDVIRQPNEIAPGPGWPAQKKTNGGGQNYDYGMDPDIVNNATWAANIKSDLMAVPTFSIVMDLAQFVNIYSNPGADGIANERAASVELIYPDDTEGFQINCGIRIRGGFSRSQDNPKHAFRLFFRQEYGASKLNYPVFGATGASSFDKFDLRTMQNYSWSFGGDPAMMCLRDVSSRDAQLAMNGLGTRGNFYHLYINGIYWGLYNSEERPEAAFAESYVGGREEDYDVIKQIDGYTSGATDGNTAAWYRLWEAATNGFASDADYFKVQGLNPDGSPNAAYENLLDVPNLIDYMLVILYGGNLDAPISNFLGNDSPNNWYGFRDRSGQNGGFRFISHDAEHTLLNVGADRTGINDLSSTGGQYGVINSDWTCGNPLTQLVNNVYTPSGAQPRSTPQYIWFRLHQNAEFRMLAADRIQKHCFNGGPFSTEGMRAMLLVRSNEIQRAIVGESARWGDAKREPAFTRNDWLSAFNGVINNFVNGRTAVLLNQLRADGLFPNVNAPTFNRYSGAVPAGFAFYMTNNNGAGTIYYTLDGSDPRARGGNISPTAVAYVPGTAIFVNATLTVRARVRNGTVWSAVTEATLYPAQDFTKLLVTELMYNPPDVGATPGDEFEFLELKNTGALTLDLSGLNFNGITFFFTNGARLAPGQFWVIGRNATTLGAKYPGLVINGIYSGRLANEGETISLLHPLGNRVLSVDYKDSGKWPLTPDGFGFSLVPRNPNANPNPDNPSTWRASNNRGGSPGADDPGATIPAVVVNEALTHSDPPLQDYIELHNPTGSAVDIGGWFLSDDGNAPMKYRILDGTSIDAGGYRVFYETDFNPTPGTNNSFTLSSQGEEVYLSSGDGATNLTGYSHGFTFDAAETGVPFGRHVISTGEERFVAQISRTPDAANSGPRVGPVVVRQIMYHPPDLPGGVDNTDEEYVELQNISGAPVALFDPAHATNRWHLRGAVDFDFPASVSLGAGQSLVLVSFDPANAAATAAFRGKYALFAGVPLFGPFSGRLDNSGETVRLEKPDSPETNGVPYVVVDEVGYKDSAPWPVSPDGDGPALQRVSLTAFGDDPANWVGAAPLKVLSLAPLVATVRPGTNAATITNVTFSVAASGTGTLLYQWRHNGVNLAGQTSTNLTITDVQVEDQGDYTVVITDLAGTIVSQPAQLVVLVTPTFVLTPANVAVVAGADMTWSASAAGSPAPIGFSWRRISPSAIFSNDLSSTRSSFFTLNSTARGFVLTSNMLSSNYNCRLVISNAATVGPGIAASFTVTVLADTDLDGVPDLWEIANGLSPTSPLDGSLDADGDGMKNREEYIAGTNPTNELSYLKVDQVSVSSPAQISFQALSNRTYSVLFTDTASLSGWQKLADVVARSTDRMETLIDPNPATNRFYRIATPQVP